MGMTVQGLHKRLGKLIENGEGRNPVLIDKPSFQDSREGDGVNVLPLEGLGVRMLVVADDDGGTKFNKDGSESMRRSCVFVGNAAANMRGDIVDGWPNHS